MRPWRGGFLIVATALHAQVVETPLAFDAAERIRALTPGLVSRLDLKAPAWTVQGDFTAARLFSQNTGGLVLVVERPSGQVERFALLPEQVQALRAAVEARAEMLAEKNDTVLGRPVADRVTFTRFVKNQMVLGGLLYGPLVVGMTDNAQTGAILYLLTLGATYFVASSAPNGEVSRAVTDMSTDGAIRGAVGAGLLVYAVSDDPNRRVASATVLGGALLGSSLAYGFGAAVTESEAQSAMKFSTIAAATAFMATRAAGVEIGKQRAWFAGPVVAAGLVGYVLGPSYPRRVSYNVTTGDVRMLPIGATLGALLASGAFVSVFDERIPWGLATGGAILGTIVADRVWVAPFDHSDADALTTWFGLGVGAGGATLLGLFVNRTEVRAAMIAGGAWAGAVAAHQLARPELARTRTSSVLKKAAGPVEVSFNPLGAGLVALGAQGIQSLVTLRF